MIVEAQDMVNYYVRPQTDDITNLWTSSWLTILRATYISLLYFVVLWRCNWLSNDTMGRRLVVSYRNSGYRAVTGIAFGERQDMPSFGILKSNFSSVHGRSFGSNAVP